MRQRRWSLDEKMAVVIGGLRGNKSVAEICREHKISQTLYYKWCDRFLEAGKRGLANGSADNKAYKAEMERLK